MADKHHHDGLHDEEVDHKNNVIHEEVLKEPELMSEAYLAENKEHQQGLWVSGAGIQRITRGILTDRWLLY